MSVPATERIPLGESAYRQLRADIVSCRLAPGQRLTERGLAASTGFGMTPIREALTRLDHDGLVRTLPRKGYQVTPLTLKSVDDLFTLWRIVGPEIARLGVRDANVGQRDRAAAVVAETMNLRADGQGDGRDGTLRLVELAGELFEILAEATGNDYLVGIYRRIRNDMTRVWAIVIDADAAMPDLAADRAWLELLERHDGNTAAADAEATIGAAHTRILQILSRWPSVAASEITSPQS